MELSGVVLTSPPARRPGGTRDAGRGASLAGLWSLVEAWELNPSPGPSPEEGGETRWGGGGVLRSADDL